MKRTLIVMGILAVATGLASGQDVPGFQKSAADAMKSAKSSHKPMYLHFTTDWCGWCRKMGKEIYASDAGKKALADFVPASIDCTDEARSKGSIDTMHMYGCSGYPSIVIMTDDGAVLNSWSGYMAVDGFVGELERAKKAIEEYKKFQEDTAKDDKKTYEYNAKALPVFVKFKKFDSIMTCANAMLKLDAKGEKPETLDAKYAILGAAVASGGRLANIKTSFEAVKKADPKNEKGYWEKATLDVMEACYRANDLRGAAAVVNELTSKAPELKNGVEIWCRLAVVYTMGRADKEAEAALAKAAAVKDADPTVIAVYKEKIAKIKEEGKR